MKQKNLTSDEATANQQPEDGQTDGWTDRNRQISGKQVFALIYYQ